MYGPTGWLFLINEYLCRESSNKIWSVGPSAYGFLPAPLQGVQGHLADETPLPRRTLQ